MRFEDLKEVSELADWGDTSSEVEPGDIVIDNWGEFYAVLKNGFLYPLRNENGRTMDDFASVDSGSPMKPFTKFTGVVK